MADSTEARISIEAPPADVLEVIADVQAYPAWARGVRSVEVLTTTGGRPEQVRFVVDDGPIADTYTLRYTWPDGPEGTVEWQLVAATLLRRLDGSYSLAAHDGGTDVTYRLAVDLRLPLPGVLRRRAQKVITATALGDLKMRVEA